MSHLKNLRGTLTRQVLKNFSPHKKQKKLKPSLPISVVQNSSRDFATKAATVLEQNVLSSPWGEITVGNETMMDFIFKDIDLWSDAPCVVSLIYFVYYRNLLPNDTYLQTYNINSSKPNFIKKVVRKTHYITYLLVNSTSALSLYS